MQLKTVKGSFDVAYQRETAGKPKHKNDAMDLLFPESEVMKIMRAKEEQQAAIDACAFKDDIYERRLRQEEEYRRTLCPQHNHDNNN